MSWIKRLKEDQNNQLRHIYKEYRSECTVWITKNHRIDEDEAIELFQNAVIILYDNAIQNKIKEGNASLKSYLFSIVKNKAFELMRKKKKTTHAKSFDFCSELMLEDEEREAKLLKEERYKMLDIGLIKLGDPCKTLLQLFYYSRMRLDEIQQIMGYETKDSVKTAKYKCIKRLKKLVA